MMEAAKNAFIEKMERWEPPSTLQIALVCRAMGKIPLPVTRGVPLRFHVYYYKHSIHVQPRLSILSQ
jgi:hypothetical protein